jgi:hypothetical protein
LKRLTHSQKAQLWTPVDLSHTPAQ